MITIDLRRASIRTVSTASTIRTDRRGATAGAASSGWRTVYGFIGLTVLLALVSQGLLVRRAVAGTQIFATLDYQAASLPGCADANGFRDSVQRQLGYDPFRAPAERRVAVRVSRADAGYEGRIQWTDARGRNVGERRLSTRRPGCAEIVNNLAFAVAVQLQLLAAVTPPPAPPAPALSESSAPPASPGAGSPGSSSTVAVEAAPATERPSPPSAPPAIEPPPAPQRSTSPAAIGVAAPSTSDPATAGTFRLSIGLGPSLALALAPRPTATGRLFVDGRLSWFSFELSFDGALPVEQQEAAGAGFSLHRFASQGAACAHSRVIGACVAAGLAYLQASGAGVDAPRTPGGLSAQSGVRLFATQDFGSRYFASVRVEGLVVLSRWTVVLNELSVWSTPRLATLIGVDVGARIF